MGGIARYCKHVIRFHRVFMTWNIVLPASGPYVQSDKIKSPYIRKTLFVFSCIGTGFAPSYISVKYVIFPTRIGFNGQENSRQNGFLFCLYKLFIYFSFIFIYLHVLRFLKNSQKNLIKPTLYLYYCILQSIIVTCMHATVISNRIT